MVLIARCMQGLPASLRSQLLDPEDPPQEAAAVEVVQRGLATLISDPEPQWLTNDYKARFIQGQKSVSKVSLQRDCRVTGVAGIAV
jgi:hypothetical protein